MSDSVPTKRPSVAPPVPKPYSSPGRIDLCVFPGMFALTGVIGYRFFGNVHRVHVRFHNCNHRGHFRDHRVRGHVRLPRL